MVLGLRIFLIEWLCHIRFLRKEDDDTGVFFFAENCFVLSWSCIFQLYYLHFIKCFHMVSISELHNNCKVDLVGIVVPCLKKLRLKGLSWKSADLVVEFYFVSHLMLFMTS